MNGFRFDRNDEFYMFDDYSNFSVNQHLFIQVHGKSKREKSKRSVYDNFSLSERYKKKILFRMSHRSGIPVTPELDKAISETRAGKYRLLQVRFFIKGISIKFSLFTGLSWL